MERLPEFEPNSPNWLVRAYHTPVSDALRGRISGRLDVRHAIVASGLPAPLARLIYAVVRRTRLWRREKLDVANELACHFADGLQAGRSAEILIEDFGSPKQAARLIRQAKRRGRPLYWQAWWYLSRGFAALLAISILGYALLAALFYLGRPTLAHNYWNEINASRSVPDDERAWPLYRAALVKLGKQDPRLLSEHWRAQPGDEEWPALEALLKRHRASIELTREAAKHPHLGYLLGDAADRVASADSIFNDRAALAESNKCLLNVSLDGVHGLRDLARLVGADSRRAAAAGDSATVLADLSTLLSLSEHTFQPRATMVEQLVGYAIFSQAAEETRTILDRYPAVLSDSQLRDLAHEFAAYRSGSPTVDFSAERIAFDDVLQRAYTDDGSGDGRLTEDGLAMLDVLLDSGPEHRPVVRWDELLGPGMAALVGSRRENRDLFNSHLDEVIALHEAPPWQWDYDAIEAAKERLCTNLGGATGRIRYLFAGLFLPALAPMYSASQRNIQERDATEVVIALALWHRRHARWPERLDQLVPDMLPAVPPDRYDGQPLRYAVRDGRPVLYSVGYDRDDDGGVATEDSPFVYYDGMSPARFAGEQSDRAADHDGDWLFWPLEIDSKRSAASE